jgi:inorganic triphosphatase YgiF
MSQADREIELKFLCAPQDLAAVLAAAPAGDDETRELISVYFDTPDRVLEKAGASLRVRESGGKRVQTLKRGKGLAREEHERPVEDLRPDPDLGPLRELLPPEGAAALQPAFHVRVQRRQRLIRYGGAQIELALDQGEVRGGDRTSPICEVELELKAGEPRALFELARELSTAAPLYLSFDGKAAQGQALTAGSRPQARRREEVVLKPQATTAEAFQAAARNALAHMAGSAQALREAPAPEAIHQLRVAARRLRSLIATFAPVVGDARADGMKGELKWLAKACDLARELDVFADEAPRWAEALKPAPEGLAALLAAAAEARGPAAAEAAFAASSERFRTLLLDATAWVETGDWLADPERAKDRDRPARAFAADALERRLKRLRRKAKGFAGADDAHRHELRIEAKKLRYAAEAFASLFPAKRAAAFIARLKTVQDELGALNDAAVVGPLLAGLDLDPAAAFAAGELVGLRSADGPARLAAAGKALDRLLAAEPFWR